MGLSLGVAFAFAASVNAALLAPSAMDSTSLTTWIANTAGFISSPPPGPDDPYRGNFGDMLLKRVLGIETGAITTMFTNNAGLTSSPQPGPNDQSRRDANKYYQYS